MNYNTELLQIEELESRFEMETADVDMASTDATGASASGDKSCTISCNCG